MLIINRFILALERFELSTDPVWRDCSTIKLQCTWRPRAATPFRMGTRHTLLCSGREYPFVLGNKSTADVNWKVANPTSPCDLVYQLHHDAIQRAFPTQHHRHTNRLCYNDCSRICHYLRLELGPSRWCNTRWKIKGCFLMRVVVFEKSHKAILSGKHRFLKIFFRFACAVEEDRIA